MKILITGGLGHLGSYLIESLPKDFDITIVDNLETQRYCSLFNLKRPISFINSDVRDLSLNDFKDVNIVIHLASVTTAADSFSLKRELERDVEDAKYLISLCEKSDVEKFIFPSTSSVYGSNDKVMTEKSSLYPQSPYADAKIEIENIIRVNCNKADYLILRLGTIFGISPGMRFHTAINKFCLQASCSDPLTVWKQNIEFRRPYLSLKDLNRGVVHFITTDVGWNETYNILSENVRLSDILKSIRACRPDMSLNFVEVPLANQFDYVVSDKKIRDQGFTPVQTIQEGILETMSLLSDIS